MLTFHIAVAVISLITATITHIWPTKSKIKLQTGIITLTFASGIALTLTTSQNLTTACISGSMYLAATLIAILAANKRLTKLASLSPPVRS
jgi:hypothetical protein